MLLPGVFHSTNPREFRSTKKFQQLEVTVIWLEKLWIVRSHPVIRGVKVCVQTSFDQFLTMVMKDTSFKTYDDIPWTSTLLAPKGCLEHHCCNIIIANSLLVRRTDPLHIFFRCRKRHQIPLDLFHNRRLVLRTLPRNHDLRTEFLQRVGVLQIQRRQNNPQRRRAIRPREHINHIRPNLTRRGRPVHGIAQQPPILGHHRLPLAGPVLGNSQLAKLRPELREVTRFQQFGAPYERRAGFHRLDAFGYQAR
mmetsp:Transcript_3194/g.7104  ORF Transcript_3194/g.7104 Transcript_3194/m.7104 type:complete len:251 (-) Transcript_3194:369-1121(-)